ncbi:hypothetical protein ACFL5O_11365, partial [Myxococcota bacterium]
TNIGAVCPAVTERQTCTPGISVPAPASGLDNCGYAASSFAENVILCAINASGGGRVPAQIQVFYNDEHALTLGCSSAANPVTPPPASVGEAYFPQTGDPGCLDVQGRPLRPVLYITDISEDPTCTAGDLQMGGTPYDPVAVFGTWKTADPTGTPTDNPMPLNYWDLGSLADPVIPEATSACPCEPGSCVTFGHTGRGYGTELRFEAGLIGGHSYRLQVVLHDGDQTQGGDAGEACVVFCAGY